MKSKIARYLVIIAIFVLVLYVLRADKRVVSASNSWMQRAATFVYEPVVSLIRGTVDSLEGFWNQYIDVINTYEDNARLKEVLRLYQIQNQSLSVLLGQKYDASRAQKEFSFLNRRLVRAPVISFDVFATAQSVWLEGGINQGIHINDVAITADGLVGKVVESLDTTSRVLLITDHYSSVDTTNLRTGFRALVGGRRQGRLQAKRMPYLTHVEFFEQGSELLKDDVLVTSGLGGVYPEGIPVGTILNVESEEGISETALVLPKVDLTKLRTVYVLVD